MAAEVSLRQRLLSLPGIAGMGKGKAETALDSSGIGVRETAGNGRS